MNHYISKNVWNQSNRGARPDVSVLARRDLESARTVDEGIALKEKDGVRRAALYLDSKGISVSIALRVLLHPDERRKSSVPSQSLIQSH